MPRTLAILCLVFAATVCFAHTSSATSSLYCWGAGSTPNSWILWNADGSQAGYSDGSSYWPLLSPGVLGEACSPPLPLPGNQTPTIENFGVDASKLGNHGARLLHNGKEIDRKTAFKLMGIKAGDGKVPDDSKLLRLTVIGSEAARQRVTDDLARSPELAIYKSKLCVQSYDPADPLIAGLGFVTTGQPSIYLQRPDGKVLHRQDSYDSPVKLANALRKADPSYDPQKDPDLNNPLSSAAPLLAWLSSLPPATWVCAGLAVLLLLFPRRDK